MPREFLTDAEVEMEIARLRESDDVRLAQREIQLQYKRRKYLYTLRYQEKRGKQLKAAGITLENIDAEFAEIEIAEKVGEME